jgi:tetratricopeptide (TPR) repeat protein
MKKIYARHLAGFFLLMAMLGACAAPQTRQLQQASLEQMPQTFELAHVPFFPQDAYQCGPAALATVLHSAGFQVQADALIKQVYLPERQGSVQTEMLAAARRNGAAVYELAPELKTVLQEIAAGHPVLVLQNLGLSWYPTWHYAVAVGYDIPRAEILLRSGLEKRQVMSLSTFEHTWARSGHWAMLALPQGKLPATADKRQSLQAAVAMEKTDNKNTAQQTYLNLLEKSPSDLVALMGAGNTAYAKKDFETAESFFRLAIQHHPDSGDAWNNLAQTLLDQKRYYEAHYAIRKAIPLGGPQIEVYRQTLAEIEKALQQSR